MYTVTMPNKSKFNTITLIPPKGKVRRGHQPHRSGAGTHHDRRTNRLRSRGDQRRAVLAQE